MSASKSEMTPHIVCKAGLPEIGRSESVKLCQQLKQKPPLTRGYAVPEVGLEGDSRACYCWEVAETCGIRGSPARVQGSSRWKV